MEHKKRGFQLLREDNLDAGEMHIVHQKLGCWMFETLQSWVNRIVSIRSLLSCLACRWRIFWNYWWFRNPKQPTWNLQNTVNNGINYQPQLVSWTSEPSTVWVHRRENSTDPHKGTKVLLWNTLNEETNGPKNVVFLFKTFWNSCSAQLKCQMMQNFERKLLFLKLGFIIISSFQVDYFAICLKPIFVSFFGLMRRGWLRLIPSGK